MSTDKTITTRAAGAPERVEQKRPAVTPAVDVYENADGLLLLADLPGVAKADVNVSFEKNQLTIEAKRIHASAGSALAAEFRPLDYRRTFVVPSGIDATAITAALDRGVLRLTLPKSAALKPRKIDIKAS